MMTTLSGDSLKTHQRIHSKSKLRNLIQPVWDTWTNVSKTSDSRVRTSIQHSPRTFTLTLWLVVPTVMKSRKMLSIWISWISLHEWYRKLSDCTSLRRSTSSESIRNRERILWQNEGERLSGWLIYQLLRIDRSLQGLRTEREGWWKPLLNQIS